MKGAVCFARAMHLLTRPRACVARASVFARQSANNYPLTVLTPPPRFSLAPFMCVPSTTRLRARSATLSGSLRLTSCRPLSERRSGQKACRSSCRSFDVVFGTLLSGCGRGRLPDFCGRMVKVDAARSERWGFAVLTRVEFGEGPTAVTCWVQ